MSPEPKPVPMTAEPKSSQKRFVRSICLGVSPRAGAAVWVSRSTLGGRTKGRPMNAAASSSAPVRI